MNERDNILEELNSLQSPLGSLSRTMPYVLPDNYFATLSDNMLHIVQEDDIAIPTTWNKENPYTVPHNYFETLAGYITEYVATADIATLQHSEPMAVPQGYFDQLPAQMLAAAKGVINEPTPAARQPVIKRRRTIVFNSMRWAAAAIVILGLGVGSYRILMHDEINASASLNSIPQYEIGEYVQQNIDDFDADMLTSNLATENRNGKATVPAVSQLNDKDIEQYLNATGWD